uniref:Integrase, catalytic region, zinc finger, CCHC-type, peptidase aspartic, catalytic n=1 Tax=Tanacetum cinerariifolium TaxID=118510 RepID=A0A6L2MD74_TANCI|nr:integrase, catalytic region, zinc finger, CCHC-type, peptidase aspartic, catalytic [Tanacetum cinerariifolium]
MSEKGKDPEAIKQNISHKPIDYVKLNQLSEEFGKLFTPQQELSVEQAFLFRISNPTIEYSNKPPVKVEVPSELPKVSLVNPSLKKLKFHLTQFDSVGKKMTTPNARTKGKEIVDIVAQTPYAYTIVPGMFKLDSEPLAPMLLQNRETNIDYLNTVRFGNDHIARIMRYGDYQLGNVTISRVYYVKGIRHNLFFVGQFCDGDLEVSFQKKTCFIRSLEGVNLLSGSRDTNLYTISLDDMLKTSPICLLSKASKTKSCLWHRRLSHLNFGTLNKLAKDDLARGILRLKFQKDHLSSACVLGKRKKLSHQPKAKDTNQEKLYLLKKILREFYENVGILHQTSIARTPQQNGVVERRSRTLVEATRTMLIFFKAPLYYAEAINTACYTQNRSLIRLRYKKTPYELMQDKKPNLSFFHVFETLCHPTNDNDNLRKLDVKADIGLELYSMTPTTSSSGLVANTISQQPCILPKRDDWVYLFQPMFNEYFNPLSIVVSPVQEAPALRAVVLTDSLVSTSIDQDAPSTQEKEHSPNISQGSEESPKTPTFRDDPLFESLHENSTSQGSSSYVRQTHTLFESVGRWTKDHPIANVTGDPYRSIST